ncbi:MAG: hypothetical protein IJW16_02215 [Clostridia bacterium]|nr:hypothetical protein [Clostridia bacterium]
MKKFKTFLLCLLMFALGVAAAVGVYYLTVGEIAWEAYLEEELMPAAVTAGTAAVTLYFTFLPLIKKIKESGLRFDKASEDVNATVKSKQKYDERLNAYGERLSTMEKCMTEGLARMERKLGNIERIERIGFGNTRELVQNGYARAIAKVGEEDEDLENQA